MRFPHPTKAGETCVVRCAIETAEPFSVHGHRIGTACFAKIVLHPTIVERDGRRFWAYQIPEQTLETPDEVELC